MGTTNKAAALAVLVLVAPVALAGPPLPVSKRVDLPGLLPPKAVPPAQWRDQKAALTEALSTVPADQKPLLERFIAFGDKAQTPDGYAANFDELAAIVRDLRTAAVGYNEERLAAGAVASLPSLAQNTGRDRLPYEQDALAATKALLAKYPKEGTAHGMYARALLQADAAQLETGLAEYKKCVELERTATWCKGAHAQLVADYEQRLCPGPKLLRQLAAFGARPAGATPAGRVVEDEGAKYELEAQALMVNADVQSLTQGADRALNVTLTPGGAAKQREVTGRLAKDGGFMALLLDGKPLLVAKVAERIDDGRFRVGVAKGKEMPTLEALCGKPQQRKLPANLKLP